VLLEGGGGGQDGGLQVIAEANRVSGHASQIGEQIAKAVDRIAIRGALAGGAAGEIVALTTGERRRAWAAARSWSIKTKWELALGAYAIRGDSPPGTRS
jgi:hypothetical protein